MAHNKLVPSQNTQLKFTTYTAGANVVPGQIMIGYEDQSVRPLSNTLPQNATSMSLFSKNVVSVTPSSVAQRPGLYSNQNRFIRMSSGNYLYLSAYSSGAFTTAFYINQNTYAVQSINLSSITLSYPGTGWNTTGNTVYSQLAAYPLSSDRFLMISANNDSSGGFLFFQVVSNTGSLLVANVSQGTLKQNGSWGFDPRCFCYIPLGNDKIVLAGCGAIDGNNRLSFSVGDFSSNSSYTLSSNTLVPNGSFYTSSNGATGIIGTATSNGDFILSLGYSQTNASSYYNGQTWRFNANGNLVGQYYHPNYSGVIRTIQTTSGIVELSGGQIAVSIANSTCLGVDILSSNCSTQVATSVAFANSKISANNGGRACLYPLANGSFLAQYLADDPNKTSNSIIHAVVNSSGSILKTSIVSNTVFNSNNDSMSAYGTNGLEPTSGLYQKIEQNLLGEFVCVIASRYTAFNGGYAQMYAYKLNANLDFVADMYPTSRSGYADGVPGSMLNNAKDTLLLAYTNTNSLVTVYPDSVNNFVIASVVNTNPVGVSQGFANAGQQVTVIKNGVFQLNTNHVSGSGTFLDGSKYLVTNSTYVADNTRRSIA